MLGTGNRRPARLDQAIGIFDSIILARDCGKSDTRYAAPAAANRRDPRSRRIQDSGELEGHLRNGAVSLPIVREWRGVGSAHGEIHAGGRFPKNVPAQVVGNRSVVQTEPIVAWR